MCDAGSLWHFLPPECAVGMQVRGQGQVPPAHHWGGGIHQESLCEGHDPEGLRGGKSPTLHDLRDRVLMTCQHNAS